MAARLGIVEAKPQSEYLKCTNQTPEGNKDPGISRFRPPNMFRETANRWKIFQFHAPTFCGADRKFAAAPAVSARMIRAPRRKVT